MDNIVIIVIVVICSALLSWSIYYTIKKYRTRKQHDDITAPFVTVASSIDTDNTPNIFNLYGKQRWRRNPTDEYSMGTNSDSDSDDTDDEDVLIFSIKF